MGILFALMLFLGGFGCFLAGLAIGEKEKSAKKLVDADGYTDFEKRSYWRIVRYRDGKFDVVWDSGIFDKRVADKRCARLNDPNEGSEWKYGTYVVEK